jgi:hypothetical protein
MEIRNTTADDLESVMDIYVDARELMIENGNTTQWAKGYPTREMIEADVKSEKSHVLVENGEIQAVFYFAVERDPTYEEIDGAWLNDEPCGVVHRIARSRNAKGVGAICINWCLERIDNIKIDTHKDNIAMRKLLEKLGFVYCGVITILDGTQRIAFQKVNEVTVAESSSLRNE